MILRLLSELEIRDCVKSEIEVLHHKPHIFTLPAINLQTSTNPTTHMCLRNTSIPGSFKQNADTTDAFPFRGVPQ